MNLIKIVLIGFIFLESTNVVALYFFPDSKLANSIGVFKAWEKSKGDHEIHDLAKYLVNWVAGTKLIFILLLVIILFTADNRTLILAGGTMVLSISSFYWRLFPLIRKMDREGQIDPKNYSATLGWMIFVMILLFLVGILISLISLNLKNPPLGVDF